MSTQENGTFAELKVIFLLKNPQPRLEYATKHNPSCLSWKEALKAESAFLNGTLFAMPIICLYLKLFFFFAILLLKRNNHFSF